MIYLDVHPAEILALHEADVAYVNNPIRGIQLYMNCVQVAITSPGSLTLPSNDSTFPGKCFQRDSIYSAYFLLITSSQERIHRPRQELSGIYTTRASIKVPTLFQGPMCGLVLPVVPLAPER